MFKRNLLVNKTTSAKTLLFLLSIVLVLHNCTTQPTDTTLFKKVSSEHSNIHFKNKITEGPTINAFFYEYSYNGGGVAIGDLTNNGMVDIYFTGNMEANALYINKGDFEFEEVTLTSKTQGGNGWSTGVTMVDINNDGWLDIYVCQSGPLPASHRKNQLFVNQGLSNAGVPVFKEEASKYGLDNTDFSMQAAFFDYDKDGDLDMYLMNHNGRSLTKEQLAKGSSEFSALGDKFFERVGDKYIDKTKEVGIYSNAISYGLGLSIADLNNDSWPDIYVSNDYEEYDYMYVNQQNGTFKEVVKQATNHISNFSMGNDIADIDNDGYLDIVTLDMVAEDNYGIKTSMPGMSVEKFNQNVAAGRHYQYMYNSLQRNTTFVDSLGIPHFSEIGHLTGISNTDWSWAPLLADFDNDGNKDLFITNGIKRDFRNKDFIHTIKEYLRKNPDAMRNKGKLMKLIKQTPTRPKSNYIFKNEGNLNFTKANEIWFNKIHSGYSNGAAYADLDNDGDLDLVVNNVDSEAEIFENSTQNTQKNNFITLEFLGNKQNLQGIGCKATLYTSSGKKVFENYPTRGYLSSVPATIHMGLGKEKIDSLQIQWPDGNLQMVKNVGSNKFMNFSYSKANLKTQSESNIKNTWGKTFTLTELIHHENDYDDYKNQMLLPHKMSQMGPALAVADINNDALDDLFIGNATGYPSDIYIQTSNGKFNLFQQFTNEAKFEDVDALFLDIDADNDLDLYVVTGGNEFEDSSEFYKDRVYINNQGKFTYKPKILPDIRSSGSVVKSTDINQDGYPDLFIGGRHTPHNYPALTSSYLLLNHKGIYKNTPDSTINIKDIGLVTDATWTDFDNDKDLDLIIVGEWMAPLFFENINNFFHKKDFFLDSLSGWYYSIHPMDVDNDGDMDYLLGNLGSNYKYQASKKEPFEVFYNDFDHNGTKDIVLSYYNFGKLFPLRGKDCSTQQVPTLSTQLPTYDMFGSSTLTKVYDKQALQEALHLKAFNFKSGVLLNNESKGFEFIPFPNLAQVSSINDFIVTDIDNDGLDDVILAGNLFVSEIETPRNDAGYGLVLLNKNNGQFEVIDAQKTGLFVPMDVKKMKEITLAGNTQVLFGINGQPVAAYSITTNLKK